MCNVFVTDILVYDVKQIEFSGQIIGCNDIETGTHGVC